MKTYKNLYPQIYGFENLHTAYRRARAGPRERRTLISEPGSIGTDEGKGVNVPAGRGLDGSPDTRLT